MGWLYTLFELTVSALAVFGGYMLIGLLRGRGTPFSPEDNRETENRKNDENSGKKEKF